MTQLEQIVDVIGRWQAVTFGVNNTVRGKANHLVLEAAELAADPESDEELADVLILALGIAAIRQVNVGEIIARKLEELYQRRWGPVDADGVVRHLDDDGPPR